MNEYTYYAKEEMKRVDHLIYVSLKYTRTGDVLKSIINRLVQAYEFFVDGMIAKLIEEKKLEEFPKAPLPKVNILLKEYEDKEKLAEILQFYLFLRKANMSGYTSAFEFRRNVTMTLNVDGEPIEVTIDSVMEYNKKTCESIEYMESFIS